MTQTMYYATKLADTLHAFGYKPRFESLEDSSNRIFPWESVWLDSTEDRVKAMLCEELFTAIMCQERKGSFRALLQAAATLERAKMMGVPLGGFIHDTFTVAQQIVETRCNIKD